jgi:hypothetical protein
VKYRGYRGCESEAAPPPDRLEARSYDGHPCPILFTWHQIQRTDIRFQGKTETVLLRPRGTLTGEISLCFHLKCSKSVSLLPRKALVKSAQTSSPSFFPRLSRNHAVEKQSPPIPALRSEWPQGIRALAWVAERRDLVPLKVGSDILTCPPILKER